VSENWIKEVKRIRESKKKVRKRAFSRRRRRRRRLTTAPPPLDHPILVGEENRGEEREQRFEGRGKRRERKMLGK